MNFEVRFFGVARLRRGRLFSGISPEGLER